MASSVAAATSSVAAKTLFTRIKAVPVKYPLLFGVVFSGCKTSFSDLLVQKVVERRDKVDWRRNAAFAAFGFFYLGGVQYGIYVNLFGRLFPGAAAFAAKPVRQKLHDVKGMAQMLAQVFIDQCVHHPLMYFPAFYCTKELVMAERPDVRRCLEEYQNNMSEDLRALWKIWVPATIINFSFMPMHLRIPFVAGVSLLWTCVLSTMRGGDVEHADDMVGGAVTGATLMIVEESLHQTALFTEPIQLEPGKNHIVITASGRDKPGWVAQLSRAVTDGGGSVSESKMVRLGDEFIIMMHVSVPPEEQKSLLQKVQRRETLKPLNVKCQAISRRQTGTYKAPVSGVRLRCSGADKPGMLASIAESIASFGMSIETVHTSLQRGTGGRIDFVCEVDCVATSYMDHEHIQDMVHNLSMLKQRHNLDVCDIRVQRFAGRE